MAKKLSITFLLLIIIGAISTIWVLKEKREIETNSELKIHSLPEGYICHGIDVSHYQNEIDWDKVIELDTLDFIYCKVSEGLTLKDEYWPTHKEKLKDCHIKYGGYHFMTKLDGTEQATKFLQHYNDSVFMLKPVLDIEFHPTRKDTAYINRIQQFRQQIIAKTGLDPIIYTSYSIYKDHLNNKLDSARFWIAMYSDKVKRLEQDNIIMWQYSDKGKIPGINGYVDLNFSKVKFTQ